MYFPIPVNLTFYHLWFCGFFPIKAKLGNKIFWSCACSAELPLRRSCFTWQLGCFGIFFFPLSLPLRTIWNEKSTWAVWFILALMWGSDGFVCDLCILKALRGLFCFHWPYRRTSFEVSDPDRRERLQWNTHIFLLYVYEFPTPIIHLQTETISSHRAWIYYNESVGLEIEA